MRFMILVKASPESEAGVMPEQEGEIEIRQLFELDDFEQGPGVDRFRYLELPSQTEEGA